MLELGLTKYIPLFVYITFIIVIFLTMFYNGRLSLYLLIFCIPLQNLTDKLAKYPCGSDILDILMLTAFISLILNKKRLNNTIQNQGPMVAIFLIILSSYIGLWIGSLKLGLPHPISIADTRFVQWKNFVMAPLLYFFTFKLVKDKKHARIIVLIMIIAVFFSSFYFYQSTKWFSHEHFSYEKREVGTTISTLGPNEIAAFLTSSSILILGLILCDGLMYRRLLLSIVFCLCIYSVVFLFSRGAYVALLIGLFFYGLVKKRVILILLFVLVLTWQVLLPQAVVERVSMTASEDTGLDRSAGVRLVLWKKAFGVIMRDPIFGVGYGSTQFLGFATREEGHLRRDVHNGYFEILMEQGLIGFMLVLYLLYAGMNQGWKLYRQSQDKFSEGLGLGFLGMMIVVVITNLFGDRWTYLPVIGYFWVTLALVFKYSHFSQIENCKSAVQDNG